MQRRSIHSAQMSHAAVGKLVLLTQHNYSQKLYIWCDCKTWSFCWENLQIHAPPVPRTHFFPSVFPTVSIHMLLSEISPPPSCFDGQIFYWTIGIWPMTCLPVVNLEIPPHKSQSKISTDQSVRSSCPLHGAMRSLCLLKGLEFGFANFNRLSLFHIRMDSGTYTRKDIWNCIYSAMW